MSKADVENRLSLEDRIRAALPHLQTYFERGFNSWEYHHETGIEIHSASPLFTALYRRGICNRKPVRDSKGKIIGVVQRQAQVDQGDVLFLDPKYKEMDPASFTLPPEIPVRKIHWRKRVKSGELK
jgi:hypothetical protein